MSGQDDFTLEVSDRRSGAPSAEPGEGSPLAGPPAESVAADLLPVEDRLTAARQRTSEPTAPALLARFADEAQRLLTQGAGLSDAQAEAQAQRWSRVLARWAAALPPSLRRVLAPYADPNVWRGMGYVAAYLAHTQAHAVRRRLEGHYELDDFGLDPAVLKAMLPLGQYLYRYYWRVETTGLEHVPKEGPALLVSNHSGVLPFDGAMIATATLTEMQPPRLARALVADWFPTLPFLSVLLQRTGQVQASPLNALRLLRRGELVVVFPEGYKGVGKLYRDRYRLARFGRGGFIRVAVAAGVPIVPVAVVGAEEIYPMIARSHLLARLLGFPFFPITPTFPWLGPLGVIPLPTKWSITFGPPIHIEHPGQRAAANPAVVNRLAEQVRSAVQEMLLERLAHRRSVFLG